MKAVVFAYSNVGDRCLRVLAAKGVDVPLVVTHRDRPGEKLWFQRVAATADELQMPFVYADDLKEQELLERVSEARPDVIFSFYYRSILSRELLAVAPRGGFNMHGSLLPKFRGRAPTNWAVLRGETQTGATLHEMVEKPDAGLIVDKLAVPILPDDTAEQVFNKVTVAAELVLWRSIDSIASGTHSRLDNNLSEGSYFGGRRPEDGRIDWSQKAVDVYNLIRAVAPPYPGAFTDYFGSRLVVASARRARLAGLPEEALDPPGLHVVGDRIVAVCGDGGLLDILLLLGPAGEIGPHSLNLLRRGHDTPYQS